jgi:hypothetical protein
MWLPLRTGKQWWRLKSSKRKGARSALPWVGGGEGELGSVGQGRQGLGDTRDRQQSWSLKVVFDRVFNFKLNCLSYKAQYRYIMHAASSRPENLAQLLSCLHSRRLSRHEVS